MARVPVSLAVEALLLCAWLLNGLRTSRQVWVVNELHHDDNEKWAARFILVLSRWCLQDGMATAGLNGDESRASNEGQLVCFPGDTVFNDEPLATPPPS